VSGWRPDDALGLPPADVLLRLFGGVEVALHADLGAVALLTYHTECRQHAVLCARWESPTQLRSMLAGRMAAYNHDDLQVVDYFQGRFVQPPAEHQLAAAVVRAADAVRPALWSAERAVKNLGGAPGWKPCGDPVTPLECSECSNDHDPREGHEPGGPCRAFDDDDDDCDGRLKPPPADAGHFRCLRCDDDGWVYAGGLTPWQVYERLGPVLAQREHDRQMEHWRRVRRHHPNVPEPVLGALPAVPSALPALEPTHALAAQAGHHRDGTRVLPLADLGDRPFGRTAGRECVGYLRGEVLPVPGWAKAMVAAREAGRADREAANKVRYAVRRAAEQEQQLAWDRALLARLED